MRIILLHSLLFLALQVAAQTKAVHIKGIVKDPTVKSIEITHLADDNLSKWDKKNVDIVNGAFNATIHIPFPTEIAIIYGKRAYLKNYIYNDAEVLIDTVGELHFIGSSIQQEYEKEFLPFFKSNDQFYDTLRSFYQRSYSRYSSNFPQTVKDSANILQKGFYQRRGELLKDYITQHPNSYVALWDLYYFVSLTPTHRYFDFEKLFSSFSDQMQEQPFMIALRKKIEGANMTQAGQIFPKDFFNGHEQMQSDISKNNQYYLVDFWYSSCAPCAKGFPKLKELYNQFHSKGFDIVSISIDKQTARKDYEEAIKKYGLTWNHVWDKDGVTTEKYNINTFPTYVLLDKSGKIINADIRADQLESFLKEHLGSL